MVAHMALLIATMSCTPSVYIVTAALSQVHAYSLISIVSHSSGNQSNYVHVMLYYMVTATTTNTCCG